MRIFCAPQNVFSSLAFPPGNTYAVIFLHQVSKVSFRPISRVSQHPFRFLSTLRLRRFRRAHQTSVVCRFLRHFRRHDQS